MEKMQSNIPKKEYEKQFHDKYVAGSSGLRQAQSIFYSNRVQELEYSQVFSFFEALTGKKLLFYGCGGHFSLMKRFSEMGAQVIGIDISPRTVEKLRKNIKKAGIQSSCKALEMDCEDLNFPKGSFDIVFARSIIHHLDVEKSLEQIDFVLKKNGKCAFIEPMGTNPLINLYRHMTPQDRTPTEHPLVGADLELFKRKFSFTQFHFLYAMALIAFLLRKFSITSNLFWPVFKLLDKTDRYLLRILPPYKLLCWDVIILCRK